MKPFGPVAVLDAEDSRAFWRGVRDVTPFAVGAARERPLWRISAAAPSRPRDRQPDHAGSANVLRLGRRAHLGRHARPPMSRMPARSASAVGAGRRACHAYSRARFGARCGRRVRAGGARTCGVEQAGQGKFRSQGRAQSRPHVGGGVRDANQFLSRPARRSAEPQNRKGSCAPACIAGSAPRPVRPMCCSATNSIPRAAAFISSRRCSSRQSRPRARWSSISTAAFRALPA